MEKPEFLLFVLEPGRRQASPRRDPRGTAGWAHSSDAGLRTIRHDSAPERTYAPLVPLIGSSSRRYIRRYAGAHWGTRRWRHRTIYEVDLDTK